jgi:2-dehydropantoate 2-reductase
MKVAIMGAGAVGCYYGGMLARAGHDVTFIGRPSHTEAINAVGLVMEIGGHTHIVRAKGAIDSSAVAGCELVLVSVKSADTEAAGRAMAASLAPGATILTLQNGVDNAERLQAVIGRPVIPAVVYVGTEMAGPGHVRHHGGGRLVIGASATSEALAKMLSAAAIPTTASPEVAVALWGKLIVNCCYNAMSAVAQIAYGTMLETEGASDVFADVVGECTRVAAALGVMMPADTLTKTLAVAGTMPGQMSSTAQDLARGKPTEIDFLNGYVVRKGAELGIPTPANRALLVVVRQAEKSGRLAGRS